MALGNSPLHRAAFALGSAVVAVLLTLLFRSLEPTVFPFFLAAVFVNSWFYGLSGGLGTSVISVACLLVILFSFPPPLGVRYPAEAVLRLSVFVAVAFVITWLNVALRKSRGLLNATLSSIGDAVAIADREGFIRYLNPVAETLTGWPKTEAIGKPVEQVLRMIEERTREPGNLVATAIRENGVVSLAGDILLISRDDAEIPIDDSAAPIRDEQGKVVGVVMVFRDVTGRHQFEERARHSQKMDAMGRLAGEVAGDFNNLLTVITGYSELLRTELAVTPLRRFAEEIMYAAERAAGLTRQLLAFSRGPATEQKLLDLNAILSGMDPVLRRLLGENIEMVVLPGPDLGLLRADPAQTEQVITHLVTNARDAMPNGGKLVLETANVDFSDAASAQKTGVPPGTYVMLAVSDTGMGMDLETRSRLFEPFFTTKDKGKGSGLGLSTVYGIVKQGNGHITVYSQPNCGTIFEIYFVRALETVADAGEPRPAVQPKGSETILLVDDEEGVRKLVSAVLRANGYSVIEAPSGPAAISAFDKNAHRIDLVLTDIVMPQMNGFELAERLAEKNQTLKILYMSGYRDNPIGGGDTEPARAFLHKPFTPDSLLFKIREVLDR